LHNNILKHRVFVVNKVNILIRFCTAKVKKSKLLIYIYQVVISVTDASCNISRLWYVCWKKVMQCYPSNSHHSSAPDKEVKWQLLSGMYWKTPFTFST